MGIIEKIFGTHSEHELKRIYPIVDHIDALEPEMQKLSEGTEMCMPGDNVEMTIELIHPVAMEQGLRFAIREGGRTVGSGRVATIIE